MRLGVCVVLSYSQRYRDWNSRAHMAVIFEGEVCTGLSGPIPVARWDEKKEVSQLAGVGLFVVEGGFAAQRSGKEEGIIN